MKTSTRILCLVTVLLFGLSLLLIIGTDTDWGKIEVTRMTLTSADGDEISALLYKPHSATPDNPAPCVLYCHGGGDMLEQGSSYAVELARRGYVVVSWDYTGCARSDIATGRSETANGAISGLPTMGGETVWNAIKLYNFIDHSKIVTSGHSMGGQYSMAVAINHQEEVFLQVNLGMNIYGSADNHEHNFNFALILGDSDESCLARTNNDVKGLFQVEQLKRIFFGDYTTAAADLPEVKIGETYTATGTNGKEYHRACYMPDSCHAYYLVDDQAVQTMVYAITSEVGVGLDEGVKSWADADKISLVWKIKDIGFIVMLAATICAMFTMASFLLGTVAFSKLQLKPQPAIACKKGSWMWWVALAALIILPVALYRPGVLAQRNFFGINISKLFLLGGTNNTFISWQWMVSIGMLVLFLLYHFLWGRKHGGNAKTYGFITSNEGGFKPSYIGMSFLFGLFTVGCGYLVFSLISSYTQQGMHIATFMFNTIKPNRTLCILMYFLFQIPYFLTSSLAMKSIGIGEGDDSVKGTLKTTLLGTLINLGGVFLLWLIFVIMVNEGNTVSSIGYFKNDRFYISTIAILPLAIGMTVANALNIFMSKKTHSMWPGLFTALMWGTWMIISTGGMTKYVY
ncbi:MAG: alpha/beta hydrolase [Clostridia bacterium]|nr:alpha/beta hydrolase [Clostridia bacterium]